jgi:hypothetical protein
MTTHVEHGTIHSAGFTLLSKLSAAIGAKYKAWRAQQIERAQIEAVKALGPEILEDIGVSFDKGDEPPNLIPVLNPYALVVAALITPQRKERGEL